MNLKPLGNASLPKVLSFRRLLGPSFILLGLGLGSGELIMWPYLSSQWGMGLIWGAVLGITFQYFLNMEIERYTLINGESVFVGLARKFKIALSSLVYLCHHCSLDVAGNYPFFRSFN